MRSASGGTGLRPGQPSEAPCSGAMRRARTFGAGSPGSGPPETDAWEDVGADESQMRPQNAKKKTRHRVICCRSTIKTLTKGPDRSALKGSNRTTPILIGFRYGMRVIVGSTTKGLWL